MWHRVPLYFPADDSETRPVFRQGGRQDTAKVEKNQNSAMDRFLKSGELEKDLDSTMIQLVKSGNEKYQDTARLHFPNSSTKKNQDYVMVCFVQVGGGEVLGLLRGFVKLGELEKDLDSAMIHFFKICWLLPWKAPKESAEKKLQKLISVLL